MSHGNMPPGIVRGVKPLILPVCPKRSLSTQTGLLQENFWVQIWRRDWKVERQIWTTCCFQHFMLRLRCLNTLWSPVWSCLCIPFVSHSNSLMVPHSFPDLRPASNKHSGIWWTGLFALWTMSLRPWEPPIHFSASFHVLSFRKVFPTFSQIGTYRAFFYDHSAWTTSFLFSVLMLSPLELF